MAATSDRGAAPSRVRVLPGSSLSLATPPPPPSSPPPKPAHLVKIAVVGDACSGKSALVHRFIHRRYANNHSASDGEICEGDTDANGAASTASNSLGTSLGTTSYGGLEPTLAEYHKKDVTIWDHRGKSRPQSPVDGTEEEKAICVRVQLWDMNVHQRITNDHDGSSVNSASSAALTPGFDANIAPLLPLLKRVNGVVIVCRCPQSPSSAFSISSNASYTSHISNASIGGWPELDILVQKIQRWTAFLHEQLSSQKESPSVVVLLSCADLVIAGYSPREWAHLLDRLQDISNNSGIASWKMCSSMDNSRGIVDEAFSPKQTSTLMQKIFQQQKQLLESMEDAVEDSFIGMIKDELSRSTR